MKRPLSTFCLIFCLILGIITLIKDNKYPEDIPVKGEYVCISGAVESISYKMKDDVLTQIVTISLSEYSDKRAFKVICYMSEVSQTLRIGEHLSMEGSAGEFNVSGNPGQFNQKLYYSTLHIGYPIYKAKILSTSGRYSKIKNLLYRIRRYASYKLDYTLPSEEASLMKTMLLGEKGELDSELKSLYQRNGIAHVLAISGLHISLLGMSIFRLLKKLPVNIYFPYIASIALILAYAVMTGFSVSSLRAAFMFILSMIAPMIKRTYDPITAVSLAAFLILSSEPLYIYHSGFIFSFSCIIGLNILTPSLVPEFINKKKPSYLTKSILSALSLAIITLPVYYCFFYQVPIYSLLLNFLIVPVMTLLVPSGIMLILSPSKLISSLFRLQIVGILGIFKKSALVFDELPGHFYTPGMPSYVQIIIYILLLIIICIFKEQLRFIARWTVVLLAVFVLSIRFHGGLDVSFIDVGQGDSILLRYSDSIMSLPGITKETTVLVDGGSSSVSEVGKYRILPYLKHEGIMTIDAIIATHPDSDHINGIKELLNNAKTEGIKISELILPDISDESKTEEYSELVSISENNNIPVAYIAYGDVLNSGKNNDELKLYCLSPEVKETYEDANEMSVVMLAEYKRTSLLLCGDIEGDSEKKMTENLSTLKNSGTTQNPVNILKVAHHGSKYSGNEQILNAIFDNENNLSGERIAIISCGKNNRYGHPHEETLERLTNLGLRIFSTMDYGRIKIHSDQNGISVSGFLKKE